MLAESINGEPQISLLGVLAVPQAKIQARRHMQRRALERTRLIVRLVILLLHNVCWISQACVLTPPMRVPTRRRDGESITTQHAASQREPRVVRVYMRR